MPKGGMTSFPSVYQLGHPAIAELFSDDVLIEEKLDGSQLSFMVDEAGLHMRSKNAEVHPPGDMFSKAWDSVSALVDTLHPDWVYRGEYLRVPHHNAITYDRVPKHHVILFDVMESYESYLSREAKEAEALRLGFEIVPVLYQGKVTSVDQLQEFLTLDSCLGGAKAEGVVCKNFTRFGKDKKPLMGKYVRPEFKELNKSEWAKSNPTKADVDQQLIAGLKTEARWNKSIQHLRDMGLLEQSPRDIGKLLLEIKADIKKECEEEIKEALFKFHWPTIMRGVTAGFPEFYKSELAKLAFIVEEPAHE